MVVYWSLMSLYPLSVAVMNIAWYSEDKPFAVGYADGKLLIGSKEPLEKGAIVVIDAHKVKQDEVNLTNLNLQKKRRNSSSHH